MAAQEAPMNRDRLFPIGLATAWGVATASIGASLTPLTPWYRALEKPWFQPPDLAFGPAWSLIFLAAAIGFVRAWRAGARTPLVVAFAVNSVLNAGWSLLFFTLQRPDCALVEVVPLWLSVLAMLLIARRHDRRAAQFIAPYLAWVTFAACLNLAIVQLNTPFGG